jgi:bifunctional non-homologous end joining protein LigD
VAGNQFQIINKGCKDLTKALIQASFSGESPTPSAKNFDTVVFGYYDGGKLMYAGRTRNGFTPSSRDQLFKRLKPLAVEQCPCPFANLPEAKSGRWGEGLTAEKMKECRWVKPVLVGSFEFLEWTPDGHLRHVRFMGLC